MSSTQNNTLAIIARQFIVHGKVQGVYFRKYTEAKANTLGLCGTVENLPNGTVKVVAVGSAESVSLLEAWCRCEGSPKSVIAGVDVIVPSSVDEEKALITQFMSVTEGVGGVGGFGILRPPKKASSSVGATARRSSSKKPAAAAKKE